ncbi:MAG TPA: efflux transporter outer membrane subunit [Cytophagaceae bacterium]|nr:efflux transporter outer membrane subunit [Cytophagaceae bacterium]
MLKNRIIGTLGIIGISLVYTACSVPQLGRKTENKNTPANFNNTNAQDTANTGKIKWDQFFKDANLNELIKTALDNNQELNILIQEINVAQFEVRNRKSQYLPFLGVGPGVGVERQGRYTRDGAVDANVPIRPGQAIPDPLPNYYLGANLYWEVDIWKKLRNSKKAAYLRYLSTRDGRNYAQTRLIAEIANSYYELMALDNQLTILRQNIQIQQNALQIVRMEKVNARVTELAVRRFEAEVLKNQSRQYYIAQQIIMTENRINFLVGRFPQPVTRNSQNFTELIPEVMKSGVPSQLLDNRPDILQATKQLEASKVDVKAARAQFYPSLIISAGAGYEAFNPRFLFNTPQSVLYSAAGQLMMPLINRNAIKASYYSANSRQIQAVYNYERTILNAHIQVANQLSNISNLEKSYDLKSQQVRTLTESIDISTGLFKSARADYMEVLLTQRDALEARFDLIEIKQQQMSAMVNVYQALGGGW